MSEATKHGKFIQALAKDHTRTLLCYVEREEGYYPVYQTPPGYITTHAFIFCKHCDSAISSSGGPKPDAVCIPCFEKI